MSIPRKRGKVKNNSPAVKKKRKVKAKARAKKKSSPKAVKRKAKAKRPISKRPARKVTKRIGKISVSVNTKPPRSPKRPKKPAPLKKAKRKQGKKRRRLSPDQLDQLIQRTISKAAQQAGVSELEVRVRMAGGSPEQIKEAQFFAQPNVQRQIAERMIEKGLMDLTKGMVRTVESIILSEMILAEQRGNLDERAKELSAEYRWPIQDVYELFHSPDNFLDA